MADPISTSGGILGLKYTTLLAGFFGAVISLSFVVELGTWARVSAVLTGTVTAAYLTPVISAYWTVGAAAENGVGFLLGLTAMNIIPAIIAAARWVRCNIGRMLSKRFSIEDREGKRP